MKPQGSYAAGLFGAVVILCAAGMPDLAAAKPAAVKKSHSVVARQSHAEAPPAEEAPEEPEAPQAVAPLRGTEAANLAAIAQRGDIVAQLQLGEAYLNGGLPQDEAKAVAWLKKAASQGSEKAASYLGIYSLDGQGGTPDYAASRKWFQLAADRNVGVAQYYLAALQSNALGGPEDRIQAYKWLSLSARADTAGVDSAKVNADLKALARRMTPKEIAQARSEAAAFVPAAPTLAMQAQTAADAYEKGDLDAFQTLAELAERGEPLAQYRMAGIYRVGMHTEIDVTKAADWYFKAANLGHPGGQFAIAFMLKVGKEEDSDRLMADMAGRAAKQGVAGAQSLLGASYFQGRGVAQDPAAAFAWSKRAADQGDWVGQASLGIFYANGIGCSKDLIQAYKWETLAQIYGNDVLTGNEQDDIIRQKKAMAAQMAPEEIRNALDLANEWRPSIEMPGAD